MNNSNVREKITNQWVSWDPVHVAIKIAICHFISQRSWSTSGEKYGIFGISHDIL